MNVFILSTGRCGSTTFIKACEHITNYTALHESRSTRLASDRLNYADNHIESDNRLSWILGRLDEKYGDGAFYVFLSRNELETRQSFSKRCQFGIMKAYEKGILMGGDDKQLTEDIAADYIQTVESNIRCFLKDKTNKMEFSLENSENDFRIFWEAVGAEGDLEAGLAEWGRVYNAS